MTERVPEEKEARDYAALCTALVPRRSLRPLDHLPKPNRLGPLITGLRSAPCHSTLGTCHSVETESARGPPDGKDLDRAPVMAPVHYRSFATDEDRKAPQRFDGFAPDLEPALEGVCLQC